MFGHSLATGHCLFGLVLDRMHSVNASWTNEYSIVFTERDCTGLSYFSEQSGSTVDISMVTMDTSDEAGK